MTVVGNAPEGVVEHVRDAALRALARPTLRAAEGLEVTCPRIFVSGHLSPEECACRLRHWPPVVTPPMPSEQPAPMLALGSPKRIDVAAVPLKNPACRHDYCWRSWGNACDPDAGNGRGGYVVTEAARCAADVVPGTPTAPSV